MAATSSTFKLPIPTRVATITYRKKPKWTWTWRGVWNRVRWSIKRVERKAGASSRNSVRSARSDCSQVSKDRHGQIGGTLRSLLQLLVQFRESLQKDARCEKTDLLLYEFVDQVFNMKRACPDLLIPSEETSQCVLIFHSIFI